MPTTLVLKKPLATSVTSSPEVAKKQKRWTQKPTISQHYNATKYPRTDTINQRGHHSTTTPAGPRHTAGQDEKTPLNNTAGTVRVFKLRASTSTNLWSS